MAVIFCRHCGRKVSSEAQRCIYCGLELKPIKLTMKCPFCAETIMADAKKCKHCGEFLDRDAAPSRVADSQTVQIFIIDKAIIGTPQDLQIQGGSALDTNIAKLLPEQTVRAIEMNEPGLLQDPHVRLLDTPSSTLGQTEESEKHKSMMAKWVLAQASKFLRRTKGDTPKLERPQAMLAEPITPPQIDVSSVSTPTGTSHRSCPRCGFVVEPSDMFCYNCGDKIGKGEPIAGARRPKRSVSFWATIALFIGIVCLVSLLFQRAGATILLGLLAIASGVIGFRKIAGNSWRLTGKSRAVLGILLGTIAIAILILQKWVQ